MKRLRHKYIKEIFFLIFVIIFSKNIYADISDFGERNIAQVTNSCEILSQSIKEIYPNRSSKYSPFLMEANTTHLIRIRMFINKKLKRKHVVPFLEVQ